MSEKRKQALTGLVLYLLGMVLIILSRLFGGTDFQDFMSGLMTGLAVGVMLVGTYVSARNLRKDEDGKSEK